MAENKFSSTYSSPEEKRRTKIMGLTAEIWLGIFVVIAAIPLLNMFALPILFVVVALAAAVNVLWHLRDSH